MTRTTKPCDSKRRLAGVLGLVLFALGCDGASVPETASRPLVYGADDRREYFETDDAGARQRMAESLLALVPKRALVRTERGFEVNAPSWGQAANLCPGERFAEQPAAAFCSAVLVDRDLILSSGHCARAFRPGEFVAVFGYYLAAPDRLALGPADVVEVAAIVDEALDPPDARPRLDYAFFRLATDAGWQRRPAPVRTQPSAMRTGDGIVAMSAGGGVPMKIDRGGAIVATGAPWLDYFSASTDTSKGSSGGGAFDRDWALLGVLARGGVDLGEAAGGCAVMKRAPQVPALQEEFTFASRALAQLCQRRPDATSLCRPACGDPCVARETPAVVAGYVGCSVAPTGRAPAFVWIALALVFAWWRRRSAV